MSETIMDDVAGGRGPTISWRSLVDRLGTFYV
jgi:hypothetical protein